MPTRPRSPRVIRTRSPTITASSRAATTSTTACASTRSSFPDELSYHRGGRAVRQRILGLGERHPLTAELCANIRAVAAGGVYLEQKYFSAICQSVSRSNPKNAPTLTERDKTVLRFIFQGMSNRNIAAQLGISESGAKSSLRQLFDKLGVRTRAQLVRVALEQYRDQL